MRFLLLLILITGCAPVEKILKNKDERIASLESQIEDLRNVYQAEMDWRDSKLKEQEKMIVSCEHFKPQEDQTPVETAEDRISEDEQKKDEEIKATYCDEVPEGTSCQIRPEPVLTDEEIKRLSDEFVGDQK